MSEPTILEQAIVSDARNRELTTEHIDSKIVTVQYFIPDGYGGTLCHVTLKNGHVVRGESSCPDEENAQGLAYTDALNKVWELERYLNAETRYQAASMAPSLVMTS
jgi:hypothetical protein